VQGSSEARGVYLAQLDGPDGRRLFDSDSAAVYVSGHLLFVRQTTVYAYPFDDERLKLTGAAFEVADGALGRIDGAGANALSAAPNGTIAFRVGVARPHTQFVWVDRSGHEIRRVGDPDSGSSPSAAPDLDQVALLRRDSAGNADVWLMETRRGLLSRLTTHPAEDIFPYWSRDGRNILFSSNRNAEWGIYRKPATGGGEELLLRVGQEVAVASDSSPDGHFLLYQRRSSATGWDLWTLSLNEAGASVPVIQTESDERNGQFSPDGMWIAYESNGSGPSECIHAGLRRRANASRSQRRKVDPASVAADGKNCAI
jgi:Tol biopolymer transport system component